MILLKFLNYKTALRVEIDNNRIRFSEEESYSGSALVKNGIYEILNTNLIAVLSHEGKNYFCLNETLIEITKEISTEYFIAEDMQTESWFKLYQGGNLVFSVSYLNKHTAFVLPEPFFPDEDYNTSNFIHGLVENMKKIHENPEVILFVPLTDGM